MKKIAIIPARVGSKRISKKNIRNFLGKPIIAYSIEAAIKSDIFDEVMVSTDSEEIAEIAKRYGANIPFLRSEKNSNDYAGLLEVAKEVLDKYKDNCKKFDYACMILPTAPFITEEKIKKANEILEDRDVDSVFTITEYSFPIQRSLKIENGYLKMRWPENMNKRSQDLEKTYHDAGQFYFFDIEKFYSQNKVYMEKSYPITLDNIEVQDIDTETDWKLAELKYRLINNLD